MPCRSFVRGVPYLLGIRIPNEPDQFPGPPMVLLSAREVEQRNGCYSVVIPTRYGVQELEVTLRQGDRVGNETTKAPQVPRHVV